MTTIAIDVGGTRIKIGIIDQGHILTTTKIASAPDQNIETSLRDISVAVRKLLHAHSIPENTLSGIGLSFPGIVDTKQNRVLSRYVKYTNSHQFDFEAWATKEWELPIVLANDAKAALIGEWAYGAGKGFNDIVLLTLGTGVGSAVMMEGRLLNGRHYLAGNMAGHMSVNVDGKDCNCGFFGCLESEASTWALPEKIFRHPLYAQSMLSRIEKIEFMHLFEGADGQDRLAQIVLEDCLKAWGLCAVNMVHAYDPDVIVIGGGIMQRKEDILPAIQKMVDEYAWLEPGTVQVVAAEQVEFAGLLGMDCLVSKLEKEN